MMTTCSLTPLQGDADNEQFTQTKEELVEIFGQIPTSYGGGEHELICLILPSDEYTRDTVGKTFTRPTTRPKNYPDLAKDATEGTRQEQVALLKIERTEFDVMRAAEAAAKHSSSQRMETAISAASGTG